MTRAEAKRVGLGSVHREACTYLAQQLASVSPDVWTRIVRGRLLKCDCDLGHGVCNLHEERPCECDRRLWVEEVT